MQRPFMMTMLMLGCSSSDKPTPSCQQAIGHYYAAGCAYYDGSTNPPTQLTQAQAATGCQQTSIGIAKRCQDEFASWLVCNDDVTAPGCDCSAELMAVLQCK